MTTLIHSIYKISKNDIKKGSKEPFLIWWDIVEDVLEYYIKTKIVIMLPEMQGSRLLSDGN